MMTTYLGDDADGLDGFEFLTMAEAGEVGHWAVLGKLNESGRRGADRRAGRVGAADPGAAFRRPSRTAPCSSRARRTHTRSDPA